MPRNQASLIAVLTSALGDHPVGLIDISRTGARVSGEILPAVGDQLTFQAEDLKTSGAVVWRKGNTCAVEFDTPIASTEVQQLRCLFGKAASNAQHG